MPSAYSFFCQHHIGKILSSTQNLKRFDSHYYATFAHITESTTKNGACSLHLPWSKTQKAWGDNIWIPHQEAPLDPIHALHKHFMKNKLKTNHPIVAYHNEPNNILTLTWSKFVCHINKILRAARKDYHLYLRSLLLNWGNNLLSYLRCTSRHSEKVWMMVFSSFFGVLALSKLFGCYSHWDVASQATNTSDASERSLPRAWLSSIGKSPSWLQCTPGFLLIWISYSCFQLTTSWHRRIPGICVSISHKFLFCFCHSQLLKYVYLS